MYVYFFEGWGCCTDIVLKTVVSFFPDSLLQTAFQKMRANFLYQDSRKDFEYFLLVARKGPIFQEYNTVHTLFRNKKFELNEMFQRNASKFATFYV